MKKSADWIPTRDPEVLKVACTGKPTSVVNYYMLNVYYQKFGQVDNAKYAIVSAQLDVGTRNVQTDAAGVAYFTLPVTIDWIEVPASQYVYTPPVPNLSDKFYLPDVMEFNVECPLPFLRGCK